MSGLTENIMTSSTLSPFRGEWYTPQSNTAFTSVIFRVHHCIFCSYSTINNAMNMLAVQEYPNFHSPGLVVCRINSLQNNCYSLSNLVIWISIKSVSTPPILSWWHCILGFQIVSSTSKQANAQAYSPLYWHHHAEFAYWSNLTDYISKSSQYIFKKCSAFSCAMLYSKPIDLKTTLKSVRTVCVRFSSCILSILHLAAWVLLMLATKCIPTLRQLHPTSEWIH